MHPLRDCCIHREITTPREQWRTRVEKLGLVFHHTEGRLYWDESVFYRFSSQQVDVLEDSTNELSRLCIEAVEYVIKNDLFARLHIPQNAIPIVKWSWENRQPSLYGRMDLAYDGIHPPKLLEYNADTPTTLLEASVVQWWWLQDKFPLDDQFNSIHERLVSSWEKLKVRLDERLYFGYLDAGTGEDFMTVTYLRDCAEEAGILTQEITMPEIGWSAKNGFVDLDENSIGSIFKLYPWEWMLSEEFAPYLLQTYRDMNWIEPIWKMVISNKGILPILWELNPGHPNLLEAYPDTPGTLKEYVRKPLLSREGANIRLKTRDRVIEMPGPYGKEGYIYQAVAALPSTEGWYPVVGSWIVDGEAAGIGIRESATPITDHREKFVPHIIG
jgi:glutathionylspermidine synthase